jgi:hypothetical protein
MASVYMMIDVVRRRRYGHAVQHDPGVEFVAGS